MKFVMVPPGLVEPMLAALKFEGVDLYAQHGELPAIGGMPVMVSRHCPPDTGYILQAEAIPRIEEQLWRNTYLGSWDEVEEPPRLGLTFSIDYPPAIISYHPRPPRVKKWYETGGLLDRVATWFYIWWLRYRWWSYPARQWVRELWWEMKWESRSPFRDGDEFDPF